MALMQYTETNDGGCIVSKGAYADCAYQGQQGQTDGASDRAKSGTRGAGTQGVSRLCWVGVPPVVVGPAAYLAWVVRPLNRGRTGHGGSYPSLTCGT